MRIDKDLFGECFCPCGGIGRVCLRGDRIIPDVNFPKEFVDEMKEKDGVWYMPSCYSVDVFDDGALLHYTTEDGDFIELGVVDNVVELKKYYLENASERDIKNSGWIYAAKSVEFDEK